MAVTWKRLAFYSELGIVSYWIPTGESVLIEAYEQLLVYVRYVIEGTGKLTITGTGELVVISGRTDTVVSNIYSGGGTFNSTTGVTISIGEVLGGTGYSVAIIPTTADPINVGEISVESKTSTQFVVKNSGSDTTSTFDWILADRN